jgi:hypothetical protein
MYRPLAALALVLTAAAPAQGFAQTQLQGVWRITEVKLEAPANRTIANPQPNLLIITAGHYSRTELHTEGPRPLLENNGTASAEQLRAVWGPFAAEAGAYEVRGQTITLRPEVAKNPADMASGAYSSATFKVVGDTLWIATTRDQKGPVTQPVRARFVRVEGK